MRLGKARKAEISGQRAAGEDKRRLKGNWNLSDFPYFEESVKMADAGRMAHFAQGLGFDLPNTFTGDAELFAHFLQRTGKAIAQAEAQFKHSSFALGQSGEDIRKLIFEEAEARYFGGAFGRFILNEI